MRYRSRQTSYATRWIACDPVVRVVGYPGQEIAQRFDRPCTGLGLVIPARLAFIGPETLTTGDRYGALADARLLWQFWCALQRDRGKEASAEAIRQQFKRPSLPPQVDSARLDELPESPGVYLFYSDNDALLTSGKASICVSASAAIPVPGCRLPRLTPHGAAESRHWV